jgi:hypothetical protein
VLARAAASATGSVLGALDHALAVVRRPAKPMHPDGAVRRGVLIRAGARTGVAFLDAEGADEVIVRESNGIGLPRGWPDIHGLAVRLEGPVDLLFSTTGTGRLSRYALTVSRGQETVMTTLFPYASGLGAVLLAARYRDADHVELAYARWAGPWRPFAELTLGERGPDDPDLSFDAVLHPPPGLRQYDVVRRLRAPSYRVARVVRGR